MYSMEAKDLKGYCINEMHIKGGRIEDPVAGVFKTVLRIELPNREMTPQKRERFTKHILEEQSADIYSYEFIGVETLFNLQIMDLIRRSSQKICNIVTSAPIKQWEYWHSNPMLKNSWKGFQKIFVRRLAVDDKLNSELLGVEAITAEHYQQMPVELREKIIFIVDHQYSKMKKIEEVNEFIKWAQKLGIKKIMFLDTELELITYNFKIEAIQRKIVKSQRKQIQAIRQNCYNPKLVKEYEVDIELPLMEQTKYFLIEQGYNLDVMKSEFAQDGFWRIIPYGNKNMEIMIKTKIFSPDNQHVCWKNSAIHSYIRM